MKSESIKELATALAKAQSQIEGAKKDVTNTFFKSKYADLSSVVEAIRVPLASNGLSYVQIAHDGERAARIETIILHASGEWLSCGITSVPVGKEDAQGFGSAMTYARRYSLSAAFGVAPEDDDGNAAAGAPPKKKTFETPHKPTDGGMAELSADERTKVRDILNEIRPLLANGLIGKACTYVDDQKVTNDQKVGLWELMGDMSAARNAMKKEWAEREAKSRAMMNDA